jgi:hypothetical protein
MLLVHLAYQNVQFGDWIGSALAYTRFAAGGFVFISGLSIGLIFLPRAIDPCRRKQTHLSLWRRALYILSIQYISALGLLVAAALCGARPGPGGPWMVLREVLLLQQGGDLLPFYVMMIAISPFLLELLRRRGGWLIAITGSTGLFIWGRNHPWMLALAEDQKFPPVLWQLLFVLGMVAGAAWPKYQALSRKWKLACTAAVWCAAGLLFVSEYSSNFGLPNLNLGLSFAKTPLSGGEALRYLSLILAILGVTELSWHRLAFSGPANFVQTLGRKSLPVYVMHLWVVQAAGALAASWWWMGRWQMLFAPIALALLWGFASVLEIKKSAPRRKPMAWTLPAMGGHQSVANASR